MRVRHQNYTPAQARIKLKSIRYWQSVLADPGSAQRPLAYYQNKLNAYNENDINHLLKLSTMSLKKQDVKRAELVSFGNYLLSDERKASFEAMDKEFPQATPAAERLKEVSHADIENWQTLKSNS